MAAAVPGGQGLTRAGRGHFAGFGDRPTFADVLPVARLVAEDFLAGTYDRVDIVYARFISTLTQRPQLAKLLPIAAAADRSAAIPTTT